MDFAQFQNDGERRSSTNSKWVGTPKVSSYIVAMSIVAGLIFAWVGLCAI